MKTKQVSRILAMALSTAALAVYGCGGGGGGGTTAPATTTGTTISGATQATSASGSGTQSASVGSNTGQTLSNLAAVGGSYPAPKYRSPLAGKDKRFNKLHAAEVKAMRVPLMKKAAFLKKAKALASGKKVPVVITGTPEPCTDGGTVAVDVNYDNVTFAYTMTMTFANCRDMDTESSGTISNSGTFSATGGDTFTMVLGSGDKIIGSTDFRVREFTNNYTNLFAAYTADMTMGGSGVTTTDTTTGEVTGYTLTFTGDGKEEYTDFIDTYSLVFTNLIFSSTATFGATVSTGSDTINGKFSESWTEGTALNSVVITFGDADASAEPTTNTDPDFTIAWKTDWALYYEYSVDGQVATDYTTPSDADCFDGTFLIDTTTPIYENLSTGLTTAGQMTINTNTTVTFNADGTVAVTVSGLTPVSYSSKNEMEAVCKIEDMENDKTTQSGSGTQTTTGTTLLATLSWTGTGCPSTGCTSDMDLHLDHYTTTPTVSITPDWHIYFGAPTDGGFGVLDYDDMEGDGPEHITMDTLPQGYYALYVDPYSLDADLNATVTVTLTIGSNIYTFPTHQFTSSADLVYRVCDVVVANSGGVTIKTPDTANVITSYLAPSSRTPKFKR